MKALDISVMLRFIERAALIQEENEWYYVSKERIKRYTAHATLSNFLLIHSISTSLLHTIAKLGGLEAVLPVAYPHFEWDTKRLAGQAFNAGVHCFPFPVCCPTETHT